MNRTEKILRQFAQAVASLRAQYPQLPMTTDELFIRYGKAGDSRTPFTPEERRALADCRFNWKFKKQQCYKNAQTVALFSDGFTYVEGFVIGRAPIPVHHAWLSLNGKVVDFTLPRSRHSYFGIEISADLVRRYELKVKKYGPLTDDWESGWEFTQMILGKFAEEADASN